MSNTIRKSSLEQAKSDFEEIRRFAQEQAETKLQEEVDKKISELVNEDINISIDEEGNIDIIKDGEEIANLNASEEEFTEESNEDEDSFELEEPIEVSDDEESIEVSDEDEYKNENMLEMEDMQLEGEEQAPVAQNTPAVPAPAAEAPVTPETEEVVPGTEELAPESGETEIDELISKMDTLINVLMQQQGVGNKEEFVDVIDDESTQEAPVDQATPAPAQEQIPAEEAPIEEEMEFEIEDFEDDTDLLEIIDFDDDLKDGVENVDVLISDEDEEFDPLEETRGLSFTSKRTGDKTLKLSTMADENGHHAPVTALRESKIKAQYESKLDELIKENKGLNAKLKELHSERKEFGDAFIQLREQFDEMQTFNGKLALVNKLLMNGGLSFEQKLNVCEQFDGADSIEDAQKIYKNIIKENNIKVNNASSKIKASTTNTAKSLNTEVKPLYESAEAIRMRQLAGMKNNSEN